jgi:type I restriction enzyme S subunit
MGREHWVETTLGECCQINPRNKVNDESLEVTFVTMSDICQNSPLFKSTQVRSFSEVKKGFTHFAENDVLFAKITPCMENGKAALANNLRNGLGCGTTELHVIRPLCGVESAFIYNFVHQPIFRTEAEQRFTGSAGQRRVPVDFLYEYPFSLPPLNEQKRIVEKLNAILPKVKNAKARLEKIPLILKKFRQSVLSAACSGRLTEDWREGKGEFPVVIAPNVTSEHDLDIPDSWVVCRAKDACINVESGSTPKGKPFTATGEIPYLKVYNIVNQNINFDYKPQFIPKAVHEKELKRCKCYPNDVLMNIVGPPLGKIALVTDQFPEWNINQALVVYRPHDFLNHLFLYYWLCSLEPIKETLKATRGSAGQVNISLTQARNIFVPLPPLEEQQEIVRRVEKLFALADTLEAKYKKTIQRVEKIEQSVLAKAFRGELADPDPTDEPVAELLNRILEEKAKLASTKKPGSKRSGTLMHN